MPNGYIIICIDIIIQLGRIRDKSRKVLEIVEVLGTKGDEVILNPILTFQETGEQKGKVYGEWVECGRIQNRTKLILAGCEKQLSALEESGADNHDSL